MELTCKPIKHQGVGVLLGFFPILIGENKVGH